MTPVQLPANTRGPVLDLSLPVSEPAVDLVLRNKTTGQSLSLSLPEDWPGNDLSLDFYRRTIVDDTGADRSGLLDPSNNGLWRERAFAAGTNDLEIEAVGGGLVGRDDFNQAAGAITGKSLELGGQWKADAVVDPADFTGVAGGEQLLRRTITSDASGKARRVLATSLNVGAVRVRTDFWLSGWSPTTNFYAIDVFGRHGGTYDAGSGAIVSRVGARLYLSSIGTGPQLEPRLLQQEGAPAGFILDAMKLSAEQVEQLEAGLVHSLAVEVVGDTAKVWFGRKGQMPGRAFPQVTVSREVFATNLATGSAGIGDEHRGATAVTRNYDRFRVYDLAQNGPYVANATLTWEQGYF